MAISPAPLSRAGIPSILERGLREIYFRSYKKRVGEFERIFNMKTSVKAYETDLVIAGTGMFTLMAEGAPPDYDNIQEAWRKVYTHLDYGMGLIVTRNMRDDDLYGVVMQLAKEQGESAAYTQEVQAMSVFNDSTATQYTAGGTNYPLLSTSHYRQDGGTWSNRLSSGADLTPESLEAGLNQWRSGMYNQRGQNIRLEPKTLVVGINDQWNAMRILNSDLRAYSADNDTNVLKNMLTVEVMTQMTNDGRWFILSSKDDHTLTFFTRRALAVEKDTDSTGTGNTLYVGSYRCSYGISTPVGIFGSL